MVTSEEFNLQAHVTSDTIDQFLTGFEGRGMAIQENLNAPICQKYVGSLFVLATNADVKAVGSSVSTASWAALHRRIHLVELQDPIENCLEDPYSPDELHDAICW